VVPLSTAGQALGSAGEQISLGGSFLALGGAPAQNTVAKPAVARLERGHQVASWPDHAGKLAEGCRPIERREIHLSSSVVASMTEP
jgi:hypothetical protein